MPRAPDQLIRFGGHAIAASATVNAEKFEKFKKLFAQVAGKLLALADLTRTLENEIWGQGFPAQPFLD